MIILAACEKENYSTPLADQNETKILKAGNGAASYIVVLNDDFEAANELVSIRGYDKRKEVMTGYLNRFLNGNGVGNDQLGHVYSNVYMGFSARLSGPQLERLQNDPRVNYIEKDQVVILKKPVRPDPTPPPETVPWGITRVGGASDGTGEEIGTAWVIDTGIDLDHPDLNVNVEKSRFFVRAKSADDDNGHGSHCAGIIAAIDNEIGVVGVAAGATLVAVKVLDRRGSGTWTGVIAGMDYVAGAAAPGDVANLSLGGGVSTSVDAAAIALGEAGVLVAMAAGNDSGDANYHSPARANHANLFTVSAMDINDNWAYFSNYGNPPVDYCAPGYSILSCYKGGGYATMSGTSMAAPHVAGLLLLATVHSDGTVIVNTDGTVVGDPDGNPDPIAHN